MVYWFVIYLSKITSFLPIEQFWISDCIYPKEVGNLNAELKFTRRILEGK